MALNDARSKGIVKAWQRELDTGSQSSPRRIRVKGLSRTWKWILRFAKLESGASVFEVGCGRGQQLLQLCSAGFICHGIDCAVRPIQTLKATRDRHGLSGLTAFHGDFTRFTPPMYYDMVFSSGVLEHYIDEEDRHAFLSRHVAFCKQNGIVAIIVPNGAHPLRDKFRKEGLGGYSVPEIDYTCATLRDEMISAGLSNIRILPNNLFGYFAPLMQPWAKPLFGLAIYPFSNPAVTRIMPPSYAYRHAYSLVAVGIKR